MHMAQGLWTVMKGMFIKMRNNNTPKLLIITGGNIDEVFLRKLVDINQYSEIIAADHGLVAGDYLNLPLDFIVGDFDSVPKDIIDKYGRNNVPIFTFPTEKDKTDTELAIELAIQQGAKSIDIVGATGSRLDHTLANMHLLTIPLKKGVEAYIIDANNKFYLKKDSFAIQKNNQYGDYISFLPFHGDVKGLSLKGFKFPLDNVILSAGESICISNELVDDTGEVCFTEGTLMVFEAKD